MLADTVATMNTSTDTPEAPTTTMDVPGVPDFDEYLGVQRAPGESDEHWQQRRDIAAEFKAAGGGTIQWPEPEADDEEPVADDARGRGRAARRVFQNEAEFEWGDERTLEEKVRDGAVDVSAVDLLGVIVVGIVAPSSCLLAATYAPWYLTLGLGSAAAVSFITAVRTSQKVDITGQIDALLRRAGSLRARWSRG